MYRKLFLWRILKVSQLFPELSSFFPLIFRSVHRILIPAYCYLIEDFNSHECKKNTHKAHFKHLSDIIFLAKTIV